MPSGRVRCAAVTWCSPVGVKAGDGLGYREPNSYVRPACSTGTGHTVPAGHDRMETTMSEKSPQKKNAMKVGKTLKEKRAEKSSKKESKNGLGNK